MNRRFPYVPISEFELERKAIELALSQYGYGAVIWLDVFGNRAEAVREIQAAGINYMSDAIPRSRWVAFAFPIYETEFWIPFKLKYSEA